MDFDIPTDLIDKAQIGFRAAAGLSSFDRKYTTLPSISTVEASISSLDPSPSYLRCKLCQGKLLRGIQSLICIYCGENQKKDLHPDPISFNSTHGYSWLLQSLNFNGSERIGSLAEGSEISGGQSPAEDELTLSELLDLKISWQHEPEKLQNSFNIKTSEHNSSLDLGTTDFDHFFSKSMQKSATVSDVLEEQPVASKADQHMIIEGQENITSDWNAEFQFADTKKENEKLESVDLFEGAETDLSAHMDVAFGQTESYDLKKPNDDSDPFQDDLFVNMSSATFQQNEQLDSVVRAKDGLSGDLDDLNIKNVDGDWLSDGNWQKSSVKSTLNDVSLQDNPNDSSTDWFENANWQKSSANNTATIKDDNYTSNDGSLQDNPNDISTDWFEDTNWPKVSPTNNNTATIKDDNLFDSKPHANDLIQSEKSDLDNSDKHHSDVTDWFQNNQWAIGGSSSTTNIVVSKDDDDDDDGFGDWNDFTSSTGNQDSLQDSWKESGIEKVDFGTSEKMSELKLFQSAVDSQEVDFGNFLQSDIFSGDKNSNDTPAAYDIFSEASTTVRNANIEDGDNAEGSKNDEITPNATASLKDVQMLMSQMHDLSFMLKNELSVPSKPDDIGTSHS